MFFAKEDFLITRDNLSSVFRDYSSSIHDDYALSALMRAIAVKHDADIKTCRTFVCCQTADRDSDILCHLNGNNCAIAVIECKRGFFPTSDILTDGWRDVDKSKYPAGVYLSQFGKTKVFVNDSLNKVVVAVEHNANQVWLQAFMSILPRILSWYFPEQMDANEECFFKSISVGNNAVTEAQAEDAFRGYIKEAEEQLNIREIVLHSYLDGYEDRVRQNQISDLRDEVECISDSIEEYSRYLSDRYTALDKVKIQLDALENLTATPSSDLFDFFKNRKNIMIINVTDSEIKYSVLDTLEFYDEDEFNKICSNSGSYLRRICNDDDLKVLKSIFVERKGIFVTNAVFSLTSMRRVSMHRGATNESNALPHPHIVFYGCGGGNDSYYEQYASSGDWDLAIDQSICATKNLNFGDSTVVSKMVEWIHNHSLVPCIKMADTGKIVSYHEFSDMVLHTEE